MNSCDCCDVEGHVIIHVRRLGGELWLCSTAPKVSGNSLVPQISEGMNNTEAGTQVRPAITRLFKVSNITLQQ
jgi:hypothetical protein